jgi:hypothetical protein
MKATPAVLCSLTPPNVFEIVGPRDLDKIAED